MSESGGEKMTCTCASGANVNTKENRAIAAARRERDGCGHLDGG